MSLSPFELRQKLALWKSIEHWYNNWLEPPYASILGDTCACCQEFYNNPPDIEELWEGWPPRREVNEPDSPPVSCALCPIYQHTGETECGDTPWLAVKNALLEARTFGYASRARPAIETEYRFLVDLVLDEEPEWEEG